MLQLIVKDEGGNKLVEAHRGKIFQDATIIDLTSIDDEDDIKLPTNIPDDNHDMQVVDLVDDNSDIEM